MSVKQNQWFETWFDTEEYHELYGHRDYKEAEEFISTLCHKLNIPKGAACVDLACGKGRHSNTLAKLGMEVLGLDLSENSITYAKKHAIKGASFKVHDMRNPLPIDKVDYIFNLFTSFGYFEDWETDLSILQNQYLALKPNGYFIQDYLNGFPVVQQLPIKETLKKASAEYHIHKYLEDSFIKKNIQFTKKGISYNHTEKVKFYSLEELTKMHKMAGFTIEYVFGNYNLDPYAKEDSNRIIVISKKC